LKNNELNNDVVKLQVAKNLPILFNFVLLLIARKEFKRYIEGFILNYRNTRFAKMFTSKT